MSDVLSVAKFGGTSMGSAAAMLQAAQIVSKNSQVKVVVVSATSGTTNQLLEIFRLSRLAELDQVTALLEALEVRHTKIAGDLRCGSEKLELLKKLYKEGKSISKKLATLKVKETEKKEAVLLDQLLSLGERLSSVLFTQALLNESKKAEVFDIRKVLRTDGRFGKAEPDPVAIEKLAQEILVPFLSHHDVVVTQGFIGSDSKGRTTTLGRGGSDFSAALIGEGLHAQEVHIWTDVNGIFTMDPNAVPTARRIEKISFSEAAELANFGAKVLHPATLWPAVRKNIRVFIGSTFSPQGGGTWIYPELNDLPRIRAVAVRKSQTLITVSSLRMLNAHGFLAKIFHILAQHQLSVDLVTTSEVSVALTIDGTSLGSSGKSIIENKELLKQLEAYATVKIEDGLSLVGIIGNGLTHTSGISAKAFGALKDFNLRLICHGASSHNLCFLVEAREAAVIAKTIHQVFIDTESV